MHLVFSGSDTDITARAVERFHILITFLREEWDKQYNTFDTINRIIPIPLP